MNSQGANDVSPEAMQARIQQARREAETLKDRIKRKKDELSDTTRMCSIDAHDRRHVVDMDIIARGLVAVSLKPFASELC